MPVLPVRAVHFHHADAGRGQVPGQGRPVAAGPFDADQGDGPETAQPAQQGCVPGCGGRELPHPQQPSDRVECGGDMRVSVGIDAAGDAGRASVSGISVRAADEDARVFYDGHSRPFPC